MEDKEIIERQQSTLEEDPKFQMLAISGGRASRAFPARSRQLVNAEKGWRGRSVYRPAPDDDCRRSDW